MYFIIAAYKWSGDHNSLQVSFPFDKSFLQNNDLTQASICAYYNSVQTYHRLKTSGQEWSWSENNFKRVKIVDISSMPDTDGDNKYEISLSDISNGTNDWVYYSHSDHNSSYYDCKYYGQINAIDILITPPKFTTTLKKLDSITIKKKVLKSDWTTNYEATLATETSEGVKFDYDPNYSLCKNAPGSPAGKGKLTLTSVQKLGKGGAPCLPPTEFTYGYNPDYNQHSWDVWNGYTSQGDRLNHLNSMRKTIADNDASAWNLKNIFTPTGGIIKVEYESDIINKIGGDEQNKLALFTPWFCEAYNARSNENTSDHIIISDPSFQYGCLYNRNYTFGGKPLNDLVQIFNEYCEYYGTTEMPAALSYHSSINDPNTYLEIGKQNKVMITSIVGNTVYFRSLETYPLHFMVSQSDRMYNGSDLLEKLDPYNGTTPKGGYTIYTLLDKYPWLFAISPNFMFGGGHRVKSISVSDANATQKTVYKYKNGYLTIMPSIAYAALDYQIRVGNFTYPRETWLRPNYTGYVYEDVLVNHGLNILGPPPLVGYGTVEVYDVNEQGNILNGKTEYVYYTADDYPFCFKGMTFDSKKHSVMWGATKAKINNMTGMQGRNKSITSYALKPNTTGLSPNDFFPVKKDEIQYCFSKDIITPSRGILMPYAHDVGMIDYENPDLGDTYTQYAPLGIMQQVYNSRFESQSQRLVNNITQNVYIVGNESHLYSYPVENNYSLFERIISSTKNLLFDVFTGGVIISESYDSKGNRYVSENLPAYRYYPSMKEKNMLTQSVGLKGYTIPSDITTQIIELKNDNDLNQYITHASINTWKDWPTETGKPNVWRKKDTYSWIGKPNFVEFSDWTTSDPGNIIYNNGNKIWQRTSNICIGPN